MNCKNKHINFNAGKIHGILLKTFVVFGLIFVFIQNHSLNAQVINNNGAAISVTNGTVLQGDTLETSGTITNNGTLGLRGHYINSGTTLGDGIYNLQGNWINTGVFTSGNSTVNLIGTNLQQISSTGGEVFNNLNINNSGASFASNRIILISNVNVSNNLTIAQGNIETGSNVLYLVNPATSALNYSSTTKSRVVGKFERGVDNTTNYLFPVGSSEHYNPMNLTFNNVTAGSVLSEFVASDPDSIGLPLPDPGYVNPADTVEVYDADSTGYWSVKAQNGFISADYNVHLSGSGFTEVQNATRIIKRPEGGNWTLDGDHQDGADSIAYRNTLGGVAATGNGFGWGHIRPRIQTQPEDTAICDGESATFSVVATGRGELSYVWQVLERSGGWQTISDNATYANSNTDTLLIISADTSMSGYKYRVIITDSLGNFKRSNSQATLTVNPRPVVTATPQQDTICDGETTFIDLNSTVTGTIYTLEVLYDGSIIGASTALAAGDTTIEQTLQNPTLYADSVVYRIFPYGPSPTDCGGTADTVIIWVEPTVQISAVDDTLCNGETTDILVSSPNITTNGIRFTWTVADNPDVTGESSSTGNGQDIETAITQTLTNTSLTAQLVQYVITPWTVNANNENECTDAAEEITIDIWVEPTIEINAANDTLCDGDATSITVSSPNTTTNGIRYTWTVTDNPNITGETNSTGNGQTIGSAIIQNLVNTSYTKQLVQYTITPWSVNASNENECTDINEVITIDIWIDPTPRVFSTIALDTICNDTRTDITLTTPNVMTVGEVTFDYVSNADPFLTGNTTGSNLTDSYTIDDSLHNSTALPAYPQVVRYTITPRAIAAGCADGPSITDSITVHPTADTHMSSDSVRCYLESNGTATVLAENGINIFTYEWDDPSSQTTATATGLVEDVYTITVTDNQGCIKIDSVNVGQPDLLVPYVDSVKNVSCNGAGDGLIIMDPYGGNGQYFYNWSTGDNGLSKDTLYNLSGNRYHVTITDWKGCDTTNTIIVAEPGQLGLEVLITDVSCYGDTDGKASVDGIGYTDYQWSTGATTSSISNLAPNYYEVTATSADGCQRVGSGTVGEPDPLVVDSIISTPISCAGDADGELDLFVSGGNTDTTYTYNWYTPDGTGLVTNVEDQTGLSGGKYYVTVNDWKGCVTNDSSEVNEPPEFTSYTTPLDVTCFDANNGEIDLTVTGGNTETDYQYYWTTTNGSGVVEDSEDQTGLSGGNYFVTITDAKDCQIMDSATVSEPELLETEIFMTDINCFGNNDGSAAIDIWGGTQPYTIEWSNGSSQDSIYNLTAGYYDVTVTDNNGCDTISNFVLTEPDELITTVQSENITCFGDQNGEIIITPTGGTIPYNYAWSDSTIPADSMVTNLGPGQYTVSVIDNNNCEDIANVVLTQPDPLIADIDKQDITCHDENDGYISITMFGGTPEYTYTWDNGFTEPSADMLSDGLYSITVSDLHDCFIDTALFIENPEKLSLKPQVRRPTCPDIQNGSIELNIEGGRTPYTVYWDNGSFEENLYDIRSGIFDVLVIDSSLCEVDTSFMVKSAHDFCIDIPSAFSPNGDGINEKWSIDMRDLYPYAEVEIFDRSGNRVFYSRGYEESQHWDGTLNGKELPMDTYYYIIYLRNGSKRISGTVTLLR